MSHLSEMALWLRAIYVLSTMGVLALIAWRGSIDITWKDSKGVNISAGAKALRFGFLAVVVLVALWGLYWLLGFLVAEPVVVTDATSQTQEHVFNWTKLYWRLGLSVVVGVLFWLGTRGFENLFIDKRYFAKPGAQPSATASLCGLILTAICGLMSIWLFGMWFIWTPLLICALVLSNIVVVPLNEILVPSMFNNPLRDNSDTVVKILRTGIYLGSRPLWMLGYQLIRLRNDLEVINAHVIPAKLSTKVLGTTDPGPRVTVTYNEELQYNEYPNAFLHISPEDQVALQTAILTATDAYTQAYVQTVVYQDLETWRPKENDEFFKGLRELLKSFGVLLRKFQIVNIESEVESVTDALAEERVKQQIENLKIEQANARQLSIAENANKALDLRVVGALKTMGLEPSTATLEQREQALTQLRANEIAGKDYLVPPGASSGINLLVQDPSSPPRR